MGRQPGALAPLLALLALLALAASAADEPAAANSTVQAASVEHGTRARACRRGEEWCRNRCVPRSMYQHHRDHCGRVSGCSPGHAPLARRGPAALCSPCHPYRQL